MNAVGRRLGRAALSWLLVGGVVSVAVHPEDCARPSDDDLTEAAQLAVDWFAANLESDGRFLYRYDRGQAEDLGGYNDTRHAGVIWSLWQAEADGFEGAGETAEAAFGHVEDRLVDTVLGPAFGTGSGSTGLLVAALDERRIATGLTDRDELLVELGHTLAGVVNPDGSVSADIHVTDGPTDTRSPFFTGEVMWALARLHLSFPDEGFDAPALSVRRYLIEDRDEVEEPWPPVSDHWGAYAFETMDRWPSPPEITQAEEDWRSRQLGLFSLQVRYESQRRGGITRLTRGDIALAAGVGTLGEGLGNHMLQLERNGQRVSDQGALRERADCAAHLLVTRQVTPTDAAPDADPPRTSGAWFRARITQMDDQQHALSALLLLRDTRRGEIP
jgi:hypothetical protein